MGGTCRDGRREVAAHSHAESSVETVARPQSRAAGRNAGRGSSSAGRNAHEARNGESMDLPAVAQESIRRLRRDACLLRLTAGVHLNEELRRPALLLHFGRQRLRRSSGGRRCEWRRTAPPPRLPCWTGAGRSGGVRDRDRRSAGPATCALASCTRFSPKTRWPASMHRAMMSGASKVLLTAISVTSTGSPPGGAGGRGDAADCTAERPRACGHDPDELMATLAGHFKDWYSAGQPNARFSR